MLDETKVKRDGRMAYVSVCLDLERREVVSTRCTRSISSLSTICVVKEDLQSCRGTPLLITDHAPWYKYAFESLKLDYIQKTFGIRNYIERDGIAPSNREQGVSTIISQSKIRQEQSSE